MSLAQNWPKTAKFSWRCSFIFNDNSIEVLRSNCFHGISGCHSLSDLKHRAWKHGHWFYFVSYKKKTTKQKGLRFRTYSVFESSFSGSSFLKLRKYLSLKLLTAGQLVHFSKTLPGGHRRSDLLHLIDDFVKRSTVINFQAPQRINLYIYSCHQNRFSPLYHLRRVKLISNSVHLAQK